MKVLRLIGLLVAINVVGCTAPPQAPLDPLSAAPADFFIDVAILEQPARPAPGEVRVPQPTNAIINPSRFVLFSDGTLRYGRDADNSRGANWLPPIARVLTRAQTAQVWSMARQLGLTDPASADVVTNLKLITPLEGERVVFIDFAGDGRRWNFIRREAINADLDPAIDQFVRELAELAWVEEQAETAAMIAPRRYDFGPDPYAPFRTREAEK